MPKSEDPKVKKFLEDIELLNKNHFKILEELRKIVFKIHPNTNERMMYGGIMFSLDEDFGGIFPYKNHISFEFSNGYKLKDPNKILEGNGKFRRHLKISNLTEIQDKDPSFFLKQI